MTVFAHSPSLEEAEALRQRVVTDRNDVAQVYRENATFVWTTLQRLGIRGPDLEDVLQEVFVVVHKRIGTFNGTSKMTTWLFGICLRVASAHRRRGFRRKEMCVADPPDRGGSSADTPEGNLAAHELRRRLESLLDELDLEKRAVFVMFELDEMSCDDIAQVFGVPVGTIYSRLHSARQDFQKALARMHARDARLPSRSSGEPRRPR